jgi:toxin ParE1/3/4
MTYRVELTARASRDLRRLYQDINAADSARASVWFNGLERAVLSLDEKPARCPTIPEGERFRHLLYGSRRYVYRIIFANDEQRRLVTVLHIRHGSRRPIS